MQGELLDTFNESYGFYSRGGPSQSNIYIKIHLHRFLCKLPLAILRVILS